MRKMFKYPFDLNLAETFQEIQMPNGAIIRHVDIQYNLITIWADVLPENPLTTRKFIVYATGQEMLMIDQEYIGTVKCESAIGQLVWHLYEVINPC